MIFSESPVFVSVAFVVYLVVFLAICAICDYVLLSRKLRKRRKNK